MQGRFLRTPFASLTGDPGVPEERPASAGRFAASLRKFGNRRSGEMTFAKP